MCCFWPWGNRGPSCSGLASVKSRETCIPQCQDGPLACAFSTRSNVPNVETGFREAIGEAKGEANALKTILFFFSWWHTDGSFLIDRPRNIRLAMNVPSTAPKSRLDSPIQMAACKSTVAMEHLEDGSIWISCRCTKE